ncbi:AfsR/SARP family transcriptional regulator [Lentzea aerocolonigenes]|uniref:AfsR/SARP family transcriptional regulator n=1 Tax=Lentzea aerocolonigenes TaxID=68170 RepID=UPI0006903A1F|nr:AfsR/SARP family transcriptional regulator [Lentzea aerocolonigenes]MCP2241440.1 DNA-binding transcriptional activator of the SARP family [Lentzea aerocolonigenes]
MVYFKMLGSLRVEREGQEIAVGTPQTRTVLALLVWHANDVVPLGRVFDELWGDAPPSSAKVQVQGIISRLRRLLGKERIRTTATGYVLRADAEELDVELVREDLARARELVANGDVALGATRLREALGRWHGPVNPELAEPVAGQLAELRMTVLEERVDADLLLGGSADLIGELTAVVAEHPLRERLRAQLMTALAQRGRVPEALEVFRAFRRTMIEELGVEPSARLTALHARILSGEERPTFPLRRKEHRPNQLPPALPDFVGRAGLLAELATALTLPERARPPLVVISGTPGVGKTSFAVQLAHRVRERFPDGRLFATVHGDDTTSVLHQFLRALGVPADLVPDGGQECSALLRDLLTGRRVLLVVDNAADASQVCPFVPAEPGCAVLVTSRRALGELEGARLVRLGLLTAGDSVELITRIAGAPPGDALVACCGGLPLALRIAGALLVSRPHWTCDDLAGRLADHRTRLDWLEAGDLDVRACFTACYRRLPAEHQTLFRRMGLLPAAPVPARVAAALLDSGRDHAERVLEDLVSWHLVTVVRRGGTTCYGMHDLLRCFAAEQAEPDRHAVV